MSQHTGFDLSCFGVNFFDGTLEPMTGNYFVKVGRLIRLFLATTIKLDLRNGLQA